MRESSDLGVAQLSKAFSGPVGIFWDMENCPIPVDVKKDEVAGNIRMALRVHPTVEGSVTIFSAYGDFNQFPRCLREGCQRTGINLIDVPNGRKDASDKAILVDMFLFALDNPPPCTILLISGDVDFAPALHKLGQRGFTVLLVLPAGQAVASALCNAGQYVWDWPSVARGEGFVSAKVLRRRAREQNQPNYMNVSGGSSDDSDYLMEDGHGAEIRIVDGGLGDKLHLKHGHVVGSPGFVNASSHNQPFQPAAPTHMHMNTHTKHTQIVDTGTPGDTFDELWVQPGDIEGLKNQLIKLLKLNGGMVSFGKISGEYKKMYGRPLFLSEYGSLTLADLVERMGGTFEIATKGRRKELCLQECISASLTKYESKSGCDKILVQQKGYFSNTNEDGIDLVKEVILLRAKDQGKAVIEQEVNERETISPDEFVSSDMALITNTREQLLKLETFKRELQELLVSHACRILLASFWKVYERRYSRELDLNVFGAVDLDDLLKKVPDVATVIEEQGTKRKFLIVTK